MTCRHVQPLVPRIGATYLHAEAVLLDVGQRDAPVVGVRLLHQERLLALVLLHVVVGGGADHRRLDGCGARSWGQSGGKVWRRRALASDGTVEMGRSLQAIDGADFALALQPQFGLGEELAQRVLPDGRRLHDDHGLLVAQLRGEEVRDERVMDCRKRVTSTLTF